MHSRKSLRMSRREAADALNCSVDNIRKMDRTGRLKTGRRDINGVFTYARTEIEALAAAVETPRETTEPVITAALTTQAFEMFERGAAFHTVCIETRQVPATIRKLRDEFERGWAKYTPEQLREIEEQKARAEQERLERETQKTAEEMKKLQADLDAAYAPKPRPTNGKSADEAVSNAKAVSDAYLTRVKALEHLADKSNGAAPKDETTKSDEPPPSKRAKRSSDDE